MIGDEFDCASCQLEFGFNLLVWIAYAAEPYAPAGASRQFSPQHVKQVDFDVYEATPRILQMSGEPAHEIRIAIDAAMEASGVGVDRIVITQGTG